MPDQLTQKDLDIAAKVTGAATADKSSADGTDAAKAAGDPAKDAAKDTGVDKGEGDKKGGEGAEKSAKANTGSIFDDLDDDDDEPAKKPAKDAGEGEKKAEAKADDKADVDEGEDEKKADAEGDTTWRAKLAEKLLKGQETTLTAANLAKAQTRIMKELERYKTPEDYMAAGFAARQKLRSGEVKAAHPGEGATAAEITAWRKSNGIPEKAEAYTIPEIQGHKWDETAEVTLGEFKGVAFEAALNQQQVDKLTRWQIAHAAAVEERMAEDMQARDREDKELAADDLRNRYGIGDYKPRARALDRLLKDDEIFPGGAGDILREARYYDPETKLWRKVLNNSAIAAMLIEHAELTYGDTGYTPAADVQKTNSRVEELEKLRDSDYNTFMKSGKDGRAPADELLDLKRKEEERASKRGGRRAA